VTARKIVHVEIPAADKEAAGEFYQQVFGWEYRTLTEPVSYTTFMTGNLGGGYVDLERVKPGDVLVYIDSDDIDADLARINAAGGQTLVPKMEVPDIGWLAVFTDPTGNRLALWTELNPPQ